MSAIEAGAKDDGRQKVDSKPIIENKTPVEEKGKSGKLLMLIGLLLVLGVAGGGGFWAFKHFRGGGDQAASAKGKAGKETKHAEVKGVLALDPFLVNLADADEVRFLKATFQLGLEEELKEEAKNEAAIPAMRDSIISLLSSKTAEQIITTQGKDKLREEIRSRINAISPEMKVAEVYIVDFVVQL